MRYFKMLLLFSALFYSVENVIGHNIDLQKAHRDTEKLLKYLNSKDRSETDHTDQIFAKLLDSFKEEGEKKLLFSQIAPFFLEMLDSVKATEIKDSTNDLSQMLYQSNEDFLKPTDQKLQLLSKLKEMQVSDIKIQRSAMKVLLRILREIYNVFEQPKKANSLKCKRESRRRRRGC